MEPQLDPSAKKRLHEIEKTPSQDWSLDDWVLKQYSIYGGNDRDKFAMELWLQVVTEGARLAEDVRRGRVTKALNEDLVDLFGWLCSFVGKYLYQPKFDAGDPIGESLRLPPHDGGLPGPESYSKWVLAKYPGVCPACGKRPCICASSRGVFEKRKEGVFNSVNRLIRTGKGLKQKSLKEYARSKRKREKFYSLSVDGLIDEFIAIYGGGQEGVDLWQIAAHLLEEIGEVAEEVIFLSELSSLGRLMSGAKPPVKFKTVVEKAYKKEGSIRGLKEELERMKSGGEKRIISRLRDKSIETLKEELADVFSWLSAMLFKIGEVRREVRGESKWYLFHAWLADKNFKNDAFVCFACGAGPCEDDCRAVWHVRKVFRDKKREITAS